MASVIISGTANTVYLFDKLPTTDIDYIRKFSHPDGKSYVMYGWAVNVSKFYLLRVYGGMWGNKFKLDSFSDAIEFSNAMDETAHIRNIHGYTELHFPPIRPQMTKLFAKFRAFFKMASTVYVGDVFDQIDKACIIIINKVLMDLTISGEDMRTMNFAMNYMRGLTE